jgi:TPP-dependent pyruvate/acetoin dehydrogenase alpha subunit
MLQSVLKDGAVDESSGLREEYLKAFRLMLQARLMDEKFASLYRTGKIHGGVFLSRGQEALSVSLGLSLKKGDIFAPLIRDSAGRLAFGEPLLDAVRTYLGSPLGPMRARDGNIHRGRPAEGLYAMISHLGAMISVVNGALFAHRCKGITGTVGATCIGDGASSTGAFHEAVNQAAVEKLPLVLVVANNRYAYSTPNRRQFACESLQDKAEGYGVGASKVDGTDLSACLEVLSRATAKARAGDGPQLVFADLLRLCGHGEHDDCSYIDAQLRNSPLGRDCLKLAEQQIIERDWAEPAMIQSWREEIDFKIDEAVAKAQREAAPDPYKEDWCALASRQLSELHSEVSKEP